MLVLLCLAPMAPRLVVPLLVAVVLLGAITSHLPREYRHRVLVLHPSAILSRYGGP
ncbi:MAG: hypothetical protein KDK06_10525 [Gammaproteobacteria bacterium]|nr:hypothetical protein [Gammaproteobacteria bacterium]